MYAQYVIWSIDSVDREVNPYKKKVATFVATFCLHSYSTKDAKADQGVPLFF